MSKIEKVTITETIKPKGWFTIETRTYPIMVRAKEVMELPDAKRILENEFPYMPTIVIEEALKTQIEIAKGNEYHPNPKIFKLMGYTTTKETVDNLITYTGETLIAKSVSRELKVNRLGVTDNTTTPTQSDVLDDFYVPATDKIYYSTIYSDPYTRGTTVVYEFLFGLPVAIFTWEKIGLVDRNNNLVTTRLYSYSGKTSTTVVHIAYNIEM